MPSVTSMKDVAKLVDYYEHLLQEWELWGEDATAAIEKANVVIYEN